MLTNRIAVDLDVDYDLAEKIKLGAVSVPEHEAKIRGIFTKVCSQWAMEIRKAGVSRRFFCLNLLTMGAIAFMTSYVELDLGIKHGMYAAIAAGATMGAGSGIILRSYGGGGGLDVLAVILNRSSPRRLRGRGP